MKVAISTDNGNVSAHFGRCPQFTILSIEDGKVTDRETISNPGHHPGYLPQFLGEQGVEAVIAGGGGQRAQMLFAEKNIQFILGIIIQRMMTLLFNSKSTFKLLSRNLKTLWLVKTLQMIFKVTKNI